MVRNVARAFCYNVLAMPSAAVGLLNPLVAAAAVTLPRSSLMWTACACAASPPRPDLPPRAGWMTSRLMF